jgi:hypothetical protein
MPVFIGGRTSPGVVILLVLAASAPSRGDLVPIDAVAGYVSGIDPGVGPCLDMKADLNSFAAAGQFATLTAGDSSTTIDFGPRFAGLQPAANNQWSSTVDGLRVETSGMDYGTPPPQYQYGITSVAVPTSVAHDVGYSVNNSGYYLDAPALGAGTASWTIHSASAFESFGFFVSGLGDLGGVVEVSVDGQVVPGVTLTGSSTGGLEYFGYVGDAPIHDLGLVMPGVEGPIRDVFGLSDLTLVSSVPEPPASVLIVVALAGSLGVAALRRR